MNFCVSLLECALLRDWYVMAILTVHKLRMKQYAHHQHASWINSGSSISEAMSAHPSHIYYMAR